MGKMLPSPLVAAIAPLTIPVVSLRWVGLAQSESEPIEMGYLPASELSRDLGTTLGRTQRGLQDAAASLDSGVLTVPDDQADTFR